MSRWSPRELGVRVALLLLGLCIAHLGVTLFLQSDLGSDPFNVFVQGLFRGLPWPGWASSAGTNLLYFSRKIPGSASRNW